MDALLPWKSPPAKALLDVFRRAARTKGDTREAWHTHIADFYGDLSGQRALANDPLLRRFGDDDPRDLIQALQCYFVLLADLLAVARLRRSDPPSSLSFRRLRAFLVSLSAGRAWKKLGVLASISGVPFDGYIAHLRDRDQDALGSIIAAVEALAADAPEPGRDVMHSLYAALMPRNLLHATGEFYTPSWLAQLLLEDAGWQLGQTLLDPFAGSGVFLLAALAQGADIGEVGGIDRNPVACVAARTNLILHLANTLGDTAVRLPIVCADSLLSNDSPLPDQADVLVTNPPWVGWEYVPRGYRARLTEEWTRYDLYTARGREAAFLKEDLSTLALVSAWDRFLKPGGTSAVVLRPAVMQSHLAGRGLRRLSIHRDSGSLALRCIRLFPGLRVFGTAQAPGATWCLTKQDRGGKFLTCQVIEWQGRDGWQPPPDISLPLVRSNILERELAATRSVAADPGSAWTIGPAASLHAAAALTGRNPYRVRTGVFTGGANGVYYVERLGPGRARGHGLYRNCPEGARRQTPMTKFELEDDLVFDVVRGRDLHLWNAEPGASILCPHTADTRLHAIPIEQLRHDHPATLRYLTSMRPILDARRGFSGWEKKPRELAFYALQRIGDYSFQPYKVAWRYIATDFIVAVIGPAPDGRTRLCNDKVMFIGCATADEAYFLCGLLTSSPVRWSVTATMTGTQITASAIRHLALPAFDAGDERHIAIATHCRQGHAYRRAEQTEGAEAALGNIDDCVASLFGLSAKQMRSFTRGRRFTCVTGAGIV